MYMDSGYQGLLSYKISNFNKKNENRENNREDRRRRDENVIFDIDFLRSTTFVKHLLSNSCKKYVVFFARITEYVLHESCRSR